MFIIGEKSSEAKFERLFSEDVEQQRRHEQHLLVKSRGRGCGGRGRGRGRSQVIHNIAALGARISKQERIDKGLQKDHTTVYGETTFQAMIIIIEKLTEHGLGVDKPGGVFYDIGSGTGKAVFAAAILHSFEKCVGIEFLSSLHAHSITVLNRWHGMNPQQDEGSHERIDGQEQDIAFECLDLLKLDYAYLADADVIFSACSVFSEEMMGTLAAKSILARPGTFMVTTTKTIPLHEHCGWEVLEEFDLPMSWAIADAFLLRKVN